MEKLLVRAFVGAVIGGLIGLCTPFVLWEYHAYTHPNVDSSGATLYAMFEIVTLPVGIISGAIIGAISAGVLKD